jgi:hypothetical protein
LQSKISDPDLGRSINFMGAALPERLSKLVNPNKAKLKLKSGRILLRKHLRRVSLSIIRIAHIPWQIRGGSYAVVGAQTSDKVLQREIERIQRPHLMGACGCIENIDVLVSYSLGYHSKQARSFYNAKLQVPPKKFVTCG